MIRVAIFLLGLLVMGLALLVALGPAPAAPARFGWSWFWALGAILVLGASHWPDNLR